MTLLRVLLLIAGAMLACVPVRAQGAAPATQPDEKPAATTAQEASPAGVPDTKAAALPAGPEAEIIGGVPNPYYKKDGKKLEYSGPSEIVENAPTPMLDDEGKQRLDPDGKPMFNQPAKQQRDKRGHPAFDEHGKPIMQTASDLGFDEKGKKLHLKKEKPPKMTPVSISRGTLTVDGYTGKAALNYDIADLKFIYLYAPGIGIAVVSNQPFPGGSLQKKAFDDKTLTVSIGEHTLQLASDKRLLGKNPEPGYVMLDRDFALPSKFPVLGYGVTKKAPYAWPGAKPNEPMVGTLAPPPPANLLPTQLLKPCPAGQMRAAGPPVLPGQVVSVRPCVLIPKATAQSGGPANTPPVQANTGASPAKPM